ncbi:unnamed protein product [Cylicocyclus nassatus]|uniref:Uncharacterized protein n=1 Tax=Cylicocyclus nassatus TaxID=53992 RepID=A0AA36M1S7_CYLNA|nr:unnamed protein product [Cylicocyclus nassatus]
MLGISTSLILSITITLIAATEFSEHCRESLQRGREVIENSIPALVNEERLRIRRKYTQRMQEMFAAQVSKTDLLTFSKYAKILGDAEGTSTTLPPCPEPNGTMFTTMAPTTTTTAVPPLPVCSTTAAASTATMQTQAQTSLPEGTTGTSASPSTSQQTASTASGTTSGSGSTTKVEPLEENKVEVGNSASSTGTNKASPGTDKVSMGTDAAAVGTETTSAGTETAPATMATQPDTTDTSTTSAKPTTKAPTTTTAQVQCVDPNTLAKSKKKKFMMPTVYSTSSEDDPFYNWMSAIYEYMGKEKEICDQPPMKDLNSITEDQLYGFLATLSAAHPGPFCSLCDRLANEARKRVFMINPMWGVDVQHIMRLLYALVPTAKSFCSTLAPACYDNYEEQARNITPGTICLECTACMVLGNVVQHSFLLDKGVLASTLQFLRSSLFHNTCAELCLVWQPLNLTLFPNGFTYDGCMDFLTDGFAEVVDIAKVILRPERFCSLELGWCELNEMPNIMHCLYELCIETLGDTPQTQWLCSLIPAQPVMAYEFLNVHKTRREKTWKPYHDKFLSESPRDEL